MTLAIRITVNGFDEEVPPLTTLADLIDRFQELDRDLIVEHNGRFVFPQNYATTRLSADDKVEFINPNFGG
ncbi:MAG: sulfur carrier protein ThiS [Desulfobacterales bacterium]